MTTATTQTLAELPTHGAVVVAVGTCPTCGRTDVPLKEVGRAGWAEKWMVCANSFACFDAWSSRRA